MIDSVANLTSCRPWSKPWSERYNSRQVCEVMHWWQLNYVTSVLLHLTSCLRVWPHFVLHQSLQPPHVEHSNPPLHLLCFCLSFSCFSYLAFPPFIVNSPVIHSPTVPVVCGWQLHKGCLVHLQHVCEQLCCIWLTMDEVMLAGYRYAFGRETPAEMFDALERRPAVKILWLL